MSSSSQPIFATYSCLDTEDPPILHLPIEIVCRIILLTINFRVRHRHGKIGCYAHVVELRQVCRAFNEAFKAALFQSRYLDDLPGHGSLRRWPIKQLHGRDKIAHEYMVYRVNNETHPKIGRFVAIAQTARNFLNVAAEFCEAAEIDYEKIVDNICWLPLGRNEIDPVHLKINKCTVNAWLNLLTTAAYFNNLDLARKFIDKRCCPTTSGVFPSPMFVAAFAGNRDMVILFQESIKSYFPQIKPGKDAVEGAALRGDMDMFRLATRDVEKGKPSVLKKVAEMTRNPEIVEYAKKFFDQPLELNNSLLGLHAGYGNLEMVSYLLDNKCEINGVGWPGVCPLVEAVRRSHEDVIVLLLERGADPNMRSCESPKDDKSNHVSPLCMAAQREDPRIFQYLIEKGADSRNMEGEDVMRAAHKRGDTKMVKFISQYYSLPIWQPSSDTPDIPDSTLPPIRRRHRPLKRSQAYRSIKRLRGHSTRRRTNRRTNS
ncbi:hypothetical protein GQX73_g2180 [Xylaria multiplex]|uniref:Uncharacterized protein n=1 Tax=Xylaria multiplex TaxID=323545 RepID=A0A7C8MY69_9PEZI|nr:hypothetical protein GQX73_g2180 [Xylaria multiplex]